MRVDILKKLINIKKNLDLKKVFGFFLLIFSVFIFISLLNYHPFNTSLFYFNSENPSDYKLVDIFGTNLAGILFYFIGYSSFILVTFMFYLSILMLYSISYIYEWERIASFIMLILISTTLSAFYNVSYYSSNMYGDLLGKSILKKLNLLFDRNIKLIFLYGLLVVSLVLIFRFSNFLMVTVQNLIFYSNKANLFNLKARFVNFVSLIEAPFKKVKKDIYSYFIPTVQVDEYCFQTEYEKMLKTEEKVALDDMFWIDSKPMTQPAIKPDVKKEVVATIKEEKQVKQYVLPNINDIFHVPEATDNKKLIKDAELQAKVVEEKLKCFGILGSVVKIQYGPVITLFEYEPQIDTKISKIIALEDDLAMALETTSIRIIAPIPGKSVVGFEIANKIRKTVYFSQIIKSSSYVNSSYYLPLILGEDVMGNKIAVDLVKMPHLLVAGSTGSGKSVALSSMIVSLLCRCLPSELKLILIDPKRLEFSPFADIAHLLFPIITSPQYAGGVLKWLVKEMENRYEIMAQVGAKNIFDFNNICTQFSKEKIPFIVVIIDELADLMMTGGKDIEDSIIRIAQMARAAGIHMIVATQRPSVDVVTGLIKVNFPSRISFKVASKIDSRTILDCGGADKLLGRGDMLFLDSQSSHLKRVHGAYVSDNEITKVVEHIRLNGNVNYSDLSELFLTSKAQGDLDQNDELYKDILNFLSDVDEVSISLLQRKFRIGYNRSARIIETLEADGRILPSDGGKPRKVIKV